MKQSKKQLGFSLIEIIVSFGVFAILIGFVTFNVINSTHKVSLASSITEVVASTKQQQLKAMTLETEAGITSEYGVYFNGNTYTLFRGASYQADHSSNFSVPLGDNIVFSTVSLPGSSLVFSRLSGEVISYDANLQSVTLQNTQTNEQKTILINRYGVITQVN